MASNDPIPRPPRWFQRASGRALIAAGCALPLVTATAAPETPPGEAHMWFYRGYEPPTGGATYSPISVPTIVANGVYVGAAPSGSVFFRDVLPGHYDITFPNRFGFNYGSAHFDLAAGHQAFVKIVLNRGDHTVPRLQQASGFGALLVPEQVAQAEFANLIPDGGQR